MAGNQTSTGYNEQDVRDRYQPIPDGRFYTKANFFTLGERNQVDLNVSRENSGSRQRTGSLRPTNDVENGAVPFPQAKQQLNYPNF